MFKTLYGLKDNDFWCVQHQITAIAYLVRDESCGSPLYLLPAGDLCLLSDKHSNILTYFQTKVNKK